MQKYDTLLNLKENKKLIQSTRRFFNNYLGTMKSDINFFSRQDLESQQSITEMIIGTSKELFKTELIRQNSLYNIKKLDTTKLYQEAIDDLRLRIDNMMHPTMFSWDVEIDIAFNYKFYFRKYNSDEISSVPLKKVKSKAPAHAKKK